jgi:hypothetical protein
VLGVGELAVRSWPGVTVSTDPAATLHALADYHKRLAEVTPVGHERSMLFALADLFDGIAYYAPPRITVAALAVADAAGITPTQRGTE